MTWMPDRIVQILSSDPDSSVTIIEVDCKDGENQRRQFSVDDVWDACERSGLTEQQIIAVLGELFGP